MQDRKQVLSELELFAGFGATELADVARVTQHRRLQAGDVLFHKGDDGSDMYVIASGRLKAFATSADGDDVVFRYMGPGEVIGELGAFVGGKRTANVSAVAPCELLMIQKRELNPLLKRNPTIAIRLLEALAARLVKLSEALEDNNFRPVSQRLAKCLLALAQRWGERSPRGAVRIDLQLHQGDLGDLVGATRESVNHLIRQWRDGHILEMRDGVITIHDLAALQRLVES
jgi:CRP-like cAMP-binding protein